MENSCLSRVTKKKIRKANAFVRREIIENIQKKLKADYRFDIRLVGSSKKRMCVYGKEKEYDLDYQLILTKKSKKDIHLKESATNIKKDFIAALQTLRDTNETLFKKSSIENSTSAITIYPNVEQQNVMVDIVILRYVNNPEEIIRKNVEINNANCDKCVWNELKGFNACYKKYDDLSIEKKQEVTSIVINKKQEYYSKEKHDLSGYEIFMDAVNTVCQIK